MISTSIKLSVRFAETDAMGVVYHANYLPWCECARTALLESIGASYKDLMQQGYHLPVVEAHLNYKFPAKYADEVEVRAKIVEKPSLKIKIDYEIVANSKLLVTGHTIHAFINDKGMPVKPPREFLNILRKHL